MTIGLLDDCPSVYSGDTSEIGLPTEVASE